MPVVDTPADIPAVHGSDRLVLSETDSEEECSEDEDCPISPEPGQRFSWRRNANGSKYFVPVTIKRKSTSPGLVWTYVLDRSTGRYERCQVPAQQSSVDQPTKSKAKQVTPSSR